jgi:hypothetical protein
VVSQVPIVRYAQQHFRGKTHFFPERNITMSVLTEATVIVEASDTSGTLVQARHAWEYTRRGGFDASPTNNLISNFKKKPAKLAVNPREAPWKEQRSPTAPRHYSAWSIARGSRAMAL